MAVISNISSAFRTSEVDILLCCFANDRATSWALKTKKTTRQNMNYLSVDGRMYQVSLKTKRKVTSIFAFSPFRKNVPKILQISSRCSKLSRICTTLEFNISIYRVKALSVKEMLMNVDVMSKLVSRRPIQSS